MAEQVMFLYLSVPEVVSSLTQCYFGCHKIKLKFFFYLLFQVSTKLSGYFKTQLYGMENRNWIRSARFG